MGIPGGVRLVGDWAKAGRLLTGGKRRIPEAVNKALRQEAQWFAKKVRRGIRDQAPGGRPFKALKAATIARKKSSKALIDSGTLVRSIKVRPTRGGVFVGVLRSSKAAKGGSMADIAQIHEFGAPKANIDPRPFLQPVEDAFGPDSPKRMLARVAQILGGDFGRLLFPLRD